MKKKAGSLNQAIQVDAKIVPKSEQRREIGFDFYHGGMTIERAGKLHPALYHKGLLDACHRAGVKLTAHCKSNGSTAASESSGCRPRKANAKQSR